MTINERLFTLIRDKHKHPADFCRMVGVGTNIPTNWKIRGTDPPAKYIVTLAKWLEVTPMFLLTGHEEEGLSTEELEIIEMMREIPNESRELIVDTIRMAYEKTLRQKEADNIA